jgi:hypothetical protein
MIFTMTKILFLMTSFNYVKVWINIVHDYVTLKAFQVFLKMNKIEKKFIRFNPKYSIFLHNILERASNKSIIKNCNIWKKFEK